MNKSEKVKPGTAESQLRKAMEDVISQKQDGRGNCCQMHLFAVSHFEKGKWPQGTTTLSLSHPQNFYWKHFDDMESKDLNLKL